MRTSQPSSSRMRANSYANFLEKEEERSDPYKTRILGGRPMGRDE